MELPQFLELKLSRHQKSTILKLLDRANIFYVQTENVKILSRNSLKLIIHICSTINFFNPITFFII